jgi:hypothetical protein
MVTQEIFHAHELGNGVFSHRDASCPCKIIDFIGNNKFMNKMPLKTGVFYAKNLITDKV